MTGNWQLLLFCGVLCCRSLHAGVADLSPNIDQQPEQLIQPSQEHYLDRCAMFTSGRLTRFQQRQIRVFIGTIPVSRDLVDAYQKTVVDCFKTWEVGLDFEFDFEFVGETDRAEIRIFWAHYRQVGGLDPHGGEAVMIPSIDAESAEKETQVEIEIFVRQPKTLGFLDPARLRTVLLHEIGHAIGIWGHSTAPNDIMYFEPTVADLSERDIATAQQLRQYPVGTQLHQQSIRSLKEEMVRHPNLAEHLYALGTVYVDQGDYPSAMSAFQKAITINPLARKAALQMAQIRQKNADYELALKDYLRSMSLQPTADVLGATGTVHLLQGNFELACDYLERALRLSPESEPLQKNMVAAYHQRTLALRKSGQIEAVLSSLSQGLEAFPDSRILLYDLGSTYEMMQLYPEALQVYAKILQADPTHTGTRIGMGTTLNNLGAQSARDQQWTQAIDYYQQALDHDPNCWQAQRNLIETLLFVGWRHSVQQEYPQAIAAFTEVTDRDPENATAYCNLGITYFTQGQIQPSIQAFTQALILEPNHSESHTYLRQARRQQRQAFLWQLLPKIAGLAIVGLVVVIGTMLARGLKRRSPSTS